VKSEEFISHAEGSVAELETQLLLAVDLGYGVPQQGELVIEAFRLIADLRNMLNALRRTLIRKTA
jgi:four helix bundle protein